MSIITTKGRHTDLLQGLGTGQPVVFSHGVAGTTPCIDCIKAFSETDLPKISRSSMCTLILHGDDDQIVPIGARRCCLRRSFKGATLKVYPGAA